MTTVTIQMPPTAIINEDIRQRELPSLNKWTAAGLSENIYLANPAEAKELMKRQLHHKIAYFGHSVQVKSDGHLEILCKGQFQSVPKLLEELNWDGKNLVANLDQKQWNYVSQGLCEWNNMNWTELKPFAKLSADQVANVQKVAQKMPSPLSKPGAEQKYVLQILSPEINPTPRLIPGLSNMDKLFQTQHPWIRLITPEGDLYSAGFSWTKEIGFTNMAETIKANIRSNDLWETYPVDSLAVTSIAIDQTQFEELKTDIETSNRDGIVFNFLTQNCTRYIDHILKKVGFDVNFKVSLGELIWKCLPTPLQTFASAITKPCRKLGASLESALTQTLPQPVMDMCQTAVKAVTVARNRFTTVLSNFVWTCLGGTKGVQLPHVRQGFIKRKTNKPRPMEHTTTAALIDSVKSFFTRDNDKIYLPCKVREWQTEQCTTMNFDGHGYARFKRPFSPMASAAV